MSDYYPTIDDTLSGFIGSESGESNKENRVSVSVRIDQVNESVTFRPTMQEIGKFLSIPQKKEKYFIRAIKNLKIQNNFYELALQLEEGQITEEEYNNEIDEHPEKYVVSVEYLEDPNDIGILREILKKVGLEFNVDEASELFSIESEDLEKKIIEKK